MSHLLLITTLFLPGLLILLTFRYKIKSKLVLIINSLGLSLSYLFIFALIINFIKVNESDFLSISQWQTILLYYCPFIILLFFNKDFSLSNIMEVFSTIIKSIFNISLQRLILYITSTGLFIFCILGVEIINNNGPPHFLIVSIILELLLVIVIGLQKENTDDTLHLWILFFFSASLIFSISLRGTYVTGSDILLEFRAFLNIIQQVKWNPGSYPNSYNSCLSVTLLPSILIKISSIDPIVLFKIYLQIPAILTSIIIFKIAKNFFSQFHSYLSSLIFISFPVFTLVLPMHIRQGLSFFFLGLLLLSLHNYWDKKDFKNIIVMIIYSFGLIVSHYTTAYITSIVFITYYLSGKIFQLSFILFNYIIFKFKRTNFKIYPKFKNLIPFHIVIFFLFFTYFWYGYINQQFKTIYQLKDEITKSLTTEHETNMGENTSFFEQFKLSSSFTNTNEVGDEYIRDKISIYSHVRDQYTDFYEMNLNDNKKNYHLISRDLLPLNLPITVANKIYFITDLIKKLFKFLPFLGVLILYFKIIRKYESIKLNILILSCNSLFIILLFTVVPWLTVKYDILRLYQQLLFFLFFPTVIGLTFLTTKIKNLLSRIISLALISYYLLFNINIVPQLVGSQSYSLQFQNFGEDYDRFFVSDGEVYAIKWIDRNISTGRMIHTDIASRVKLDSLSSKQFLKSEDALDFVFTKSNYVFLSRPNVTRGISYHKYVGRTLRYKYPINFLGINKNKIYSSKESAIYK